MSKKTTKAKAQIALQFDAETQKLLREMGGIRRAMSRMADENRQASTQMGGAFHRLGQAAVGLKASIDLISQAWSVVGGTIKSTIADTLESIESMGELEALFGRVGVVTENATVQVREYAIEMRRTLGMADSETRSIIRNITAASAGLDLTLDDILRISSAAVDLGATIGQSAERSSDMIIGALSGNVRAIERAFPGMADEMRAVIEEGGTMADMLSLIEGQVGGMAAETSGLTQQYNRLRASLKDVGIALLESFFGDDTFENLLSNISDQVERFAQQIRDGEGAIGRFVEQGIPDLLDGIGAVINAFESAVNWLVRWEDRLTSAARLVPGWSAILALDAGYEEVFGGDAAAAQQERINALLEQRRLLTEGIAFAEEQGTETSLAYANRMRSALTALNAEITRSDVRLRDLEAASSRAGDAFSTTADTLRRNIRANREAITTQEEYNDALEETTSGLENLIRVQDEQESRPTAAQRARTRAIREQRENIRGLAHEYDALAKQLESYIDLKPVEILTGTQRERDASEEYLRGVNTYLQEINETLLEGLRLKAEYASELEALRKSEERELQATYDELMVSHGKGLAEHPLLLEMFKGAEDPEALREVVDRFTLKLEQEMALSGKQTGHRFGESYNKEVEQIIERGMAEFIATPFTSLLDGMENGWKNMAQNMKASFADTLRSMSEALVQGAISQLVSGALASLGGGPLAAVVGIGSALGAAAMLMGSGSGRTSPRTSTAAHIMPTYMGGDRRGQRTTTVYQTTIGSYIGDPRHDDFAARGIGRGMERLHQVGEYPQRS